MIKTLFEFQIYTRCCFKNGGAFNGSMLEKSADAHKMGDISHGMGDISHGMGKNSATNSTLYAFTFLRICVSHHSCKIYGISLKNLISCAAIAHV